MKTKLNRTFVVLLLFFLLLICSSYYVLKHCFSYEGEAYMKGAGHILSEDFKPGLFVIAGQHLGWSGLLSSVLFFCTQGLSARIAFYSIMVFMLLCSTIVAFVYIPRLFIDDQSYRSLEIILTWICRTLAVLLSAYVLNSVNKEVSSCEK